MEEKETLYLSFARNKHEGQKRRGGEDYINHPIRVANCFCTSFMRTIALLHDVVEDTDTTIEEIDAMFGEEVAIVVNILTKKDLDDYDTYIEHICKHPVAAKIKVADMIDNMLDSPGTNQLEKYKQFLPKLLRASYDC